MSVYVWMGDAQVLAHLGLEGESEPTSKLCPQSSTCVSATAAGLGRKAALKTRISHVHTAAATTFSAFSSLMLTAWIEKIALVGGSWAFVSARIASLRPRRMIR